MGGYSQPDPILNSKTVASDVSDYLGRKKPPPLDFDSREGRTSDGSGGYSQPDPLFSELPLDAQINSGKRVGIENSLRSTPGLPADMALNTGNSFDVVNADPSLRQERDLWERRVKEQEDKRKSKRMGMSSLTPYDPNSRNIQF